jgi:hypothetical protein
LPWLACALGGLAACDRDVPEPRGLDSPPLQILETEPDPEQVSYPLERALRIRFNRYLLPQSVVRQSVLVTPSLLDADTGAPKGPVSFFEPVYDPYERLVVMQLLPSTRWFPTTLYQVWLESPEDRSDLTGFRAFDGTPLEQSASFFFITGDRVTNPDHDVDDGRPLVRFCDVDAGAPELPAAWPVLRGTCGRAGCHAAVGAQAPMTGLDLSTVQGLRDTALRLVARQTQTATQVGVLSAGGEELGRNMPRIDPRNAGNSYVVYKLLVNPMNHPPAEEPGVADPWLGGVRPPGSPPSAELSRLRRAFVRGEPMPPDGALQPAQMRAIVRWILQGAEVTECP